MDAKRKSEWPWYMTIASLRQYMEIAGYSGPAEDSNAGFIAAETELGEHCLVAHRVGAEENRGGAMTYRTGRVIVGTAGMKTRLEFKVTPAPRLEGAKPQLVGVRDKDRGVNRGSGSFRTRGEVRGR